MEGLGVNGAFWKGRKVVVTGHTGFKGAWLALWLSSLGAEVTGLSLEPEDGEGAFVKLRLQDIVQSHFGDIRDRHAVSGVLDKARPELLFHLAAQAQVGRGWQDPAHTYEVNVVGTSRVLEAVAQCPSVKAVVVVTSDKVYANKSGHLLSEDDELGGDDPYSGSKAAAEMVVRCWRTAHPGVAIATARAGNVIGGGDTASNRLLPDIFRALKADGVVQLRRPGATRPWQFVLEPLDGYLRLAEKLFTRPAECSPAFNFGPENSWLPTVGEVAERVFDLVGRGRWVHAQGQNMPEADSLRLDSGLAARELGWRPRLSLDEALELTVEWWRAEKDGLDIPKVAATQLSQYQRAPEL